MRCLFTIALFVSAFVATNGSALATPQRWHAELGGSLERLERIRHISAKVNDRFPAIRLRVNHVFGLGSVELMFAKRKLPPAQAVMVSRNGTRADRVVPTLLQGKVILKGSRRSAGALPASLSIIRNRAVVQFTPVIKRTARARARVVSLRITLDPKKNAKFARVSTKPRAMLLGRECDVTSMRASSQHSEGLRVAQAIPGPEAKLYKVITISTDADPEWFSRYGDESNAEIAATINAAEVVYQEQLGIRFAVVRQHVYTDSSPYVSSDASVLLTSFRRNPENPANLGVRLETFDEDVDAKYLFTGKDLLGTTVGLSYVGAMCWSPRDAYGLVQNVSREINIAAFMHEMGHTLGAQHDESDSQGIMFPQLGIERRYFSPISIGQMNRHFSFYGKCIAEEMLRPTLVPATLSVRRKFSRDRKRVIIKGLLVSSIGSPVVGESVRLTLNQRLVVLLTTDSSGIFKYSIKRSRFSGKILEVQAQQASNQLATPEILKIPLRA